MYIYLHIKEIIKNIVVGVPNIGDYYHILDYLRYQNYIFGIAEFEIMAGSFAVFNELGIGKQFNAAASVFLPKYLQFLRIDVTRRFVPG